MLVTGKPFQPSLIFVGKARSLKYSGAPERCFSQIGFGLIHFHFSWLERLARDKRSSLLQTFVNYVCKIFITLWPGKAVGRLKSMMDAPNVLKSSSPSRNVGNFSAAFARLKIVPT